MNLCYILMLEQIDFFELSQIYASIHWKGEENFVLKE
jgi:hypothetical protein